MRIYLEPFHSLNAVPFLDKATAALCWPSPRARNPHEQHPARLRSQGCPCSPTFPSSFPSADPPQKCPTPQQNPPLPCPQSKANSSRSSPRSSGLSHELRRCPCPQNGAEPSTHWICRSTHVCECRHGSSASHFIQYRRNPKMRNLICYSFMPKLNLLGGWVRSKRDVFLQLQFHMTI